MSLFTKIRCGLALALPLTAVSVFGLLYAQEPKREQTKSVQPARPGQERPGVPGPNNNGPRDWGKGPMPGMGGKGWTNPMTPPKPDKELEAWIKILGEKMTDRNDNIRNSARKALVGMGTAAVYSLKEMSESKDAATAVAAKNVMMEIHRSSMQKNMMMPRPGMPIPGFKGMPMPGRWGKMSPQGMHGKMGPGGPTHRGEKDAHSRHGRGPEGDRKGGFGGSPRGSEKGVRPEGDRKGGFGGPPRESEKGVRPEGDRKGGPVRPSQN